MIKLADLLKASLGEGDGPIQSLASSIETILVRLTRESDYVVYNGASYWEGQFVLNNPIPLSTYFKGLEYVDVVNRIKGINHKDRSGDIVLIFKDRTYGEAITRYTSGTACKAWHGSLNPSDSYVPLIVAYPGGNRYEINPFITKETVCPAALCGGNWKIKDLIQEIIKGQYPAD
ncbi:MAG: hypothetical protein N2Z74_04725 [Syntrophales bacterium]|nr:hypothetical protein [Syntrophales bacterium]